MYVDREKSELRVDKNTNTKQTLQLGCSSFFFIIIIIYINVVWVEWMWMCLYYSCFIVFCRAVYMLTRRSARWEWGELTNKTPKHLITSFCIMKLFEFAFLLNNKLHSTNRTDEMFWRLSDSYKTRIRL